MSCWSCCTSVSTEDHKGVWRSQNQDLKDVLLELAQNQDKCWPQQHTWNQVPVWPRTLRVRTERQPLKKRAGAGCNKTPGVGPVFNRTPKV